MFSGQWRCARCSPPLWCGSLMIVLLPLRRAELFKRPHGPIPHLVRFLVGKVLSEFPELKRDRQRMLPFRNTFARVHVEEPLLLKDFAGGPLDLLGDFGVRDFFV